MMNDLRLGVKMLRYGHGLKVNCILGGIALAGGILCTIGGELLGNGLLGGYILLCVGMLPTQMMFSLSVSNMVQASPRKKKMQTMVPALISFSSIGIVYLTLVMICGILCLAKPERVDVISGELIWMSVLLALIMVYLGMAYKHFVLSSLFVIPALCFTMTSGMSWTDTTIPWGTLVQGRFSFLQVAVLGLAILVAGAVAEYLLSLLFYKAPLSKMAQAAPLRKEF